MNSTAAPLLSLAHVTVMRGDREALHDVNLEIARGEHVCILVQNPQTVLFDVPSNALDIGAQLQLCGTMRQLAQSGLGILLVTHHVSEIIPEIERVILFREGHIQADGPKSSVLTEEHLCKLFGVAVRLGQSDGYFHLY